MREQPRPGKQGTVQGGAMNLLALILELFIILYIRALYYAPGQLSVEAQIRLGYM